MPKKSKVFKNVKFQPENIKNAYKVFKQYLENERYSFDLCVRTNQERWTFDNDDDFYAAYRSALAINASYTSQHQGPPKNKDYTSIFHVEYENYYENKTNVSICLPDKEVIEKVFEIFEDNVDKNTIKPDFDNINVFIGHGRDEQWKELRDHLQDKHGINTVYFEKEPRAGSNTSDIIKDMADSAFVALLVHAGEDQDKLGILHARENVIHETGYFQAKLGYRKAIVLLEDGCNEFTNISGIQQIRFAKGKIREVFGEIIATIKNRIESTEV